MDGLALSVPVLRLGSGRNLHRTSHGHEGKRLSMSGAFKKFCVQIGKRLMGYAKPNDARVDRGD